jgi:hypothetical protein
MSTHTHTRSDGTTYTHDHSLGEQPHHHGEGAEHRHQLDDGTEIVHSHDRADQPHEH